MSAGDPKKQHPTRQHFVPQLLLRGFADTSAEKLFELDKTTGAVRGPKRVREVAHRRHYNDRSPGDPSTSLESKLGELETAVAPILQRIRAAESLSGLTAEELGWLCLFVAVQDVRTPHHRDGMASALTTLSTSVRRMAEQLARAHGGSIDPQEYEAPDERKLRDMALDQITELAVDLAEHLAHKDLLLLRAAGQESFTCGDHPVAKHNCNDFGWRGNIGYAVRGIEIFLPISSRLTLGFMCPSISEESETVLLDRLSTLPTLFASTRERAFAEIVSHRAYLRAVDEGQPIDIGLDRIRFHNHLQLRDAERHVYRANGDFGEELRLLASHPALKEAPRPQVFGGGEEIEYQRVMPSRA